jgi:GNAT superfamily N-acetyltransferase
MTTSETHATPFALRPAESGDVDSIASVWYAGWREAHLGHVPDALIAHRSPDQFRERVPVMLARTTVATVNGQVAGMVVTHDDEIEQLYVADEHRGSGVAATLLGHGETVISATFPRAFLAVVAGNARARRVYERQGWYDVGPFDYLAWTPDGARVPVPSHRYEKELVPAR